MSLESEIRTALLAMPAVTALVGTGSSARIRPYKLQSGDDDAKPHILVGVDTDARLNDLSGTAERSMGTVTLSCRARELEDARTVAAAVQSGLAGYSGVFDAWLEGEGVAVIPFDDGSDRAWYAVNQVYRFTK